MSLQKIGVKIWVLVIYVDDVRLIFSPLPAGYRWVPGKGGPSKVWESRDWISDKEKDNQQEEIFPITDFLPSDTESSD